MVDNRLLQETRAVRQRPDAEVGGDRHIVASGLHPADDLAALSDEEAEALLLKELEGGAPEHP